MGFHLRPLVLVALMGTAAWAQAVPKVDTCQSPSCDCCAKRIAYRQESGFQVEIREVDDIPAARKKLGMPDVFGSCHSSKIGDYVVEGHVPVADIRQRFTAKPKALGLALPSMPSGSPGMDIPNSPTYETLLVQADGTKRVYAKH